MQPLTLDQRTLLEEFGDRIRSDVFPGKGHSNKILTLGYPVTGFYFVDHTGKTILLFEIGQGNQIKSIYSPFSPSDLLGFVSILGRTNPDLGAYLKTKIQTVESAPHKLGRIPLPKNELVFQPYKDIIKVVLAYDSGITERAYSELMSLGLDKLPVSPKTSYSGTLDEVVTIFQGEYAVVSAKKGDKRVTNTFALEDCIGLTLQDLENQVAALAHITTGTNVIDSIPRIVSDLNSSGGKIYIARLFGGYKSSSETLLQIVNALNGADIEIVEADIMENTRSRAIGISARGALYSNIFIDASEKTEIEARMAAGVFLGNVLTPLYLPI